jgi:hypothetical protein
MIDNGSLPAPKMPTNRKFGWFISSLSACLAIYGYLTASSGLANVSLIVGLAFGTAALLAPQLLTPFNRAWHLLGIVLGKVMNPVVLGLIFFTLITPIAMASKLLGRDELRLRKRPTVSYWIDRSPPGPAPDTFRNQF